MTLMQYRLNCVLRCPFWRWCSIFPWSEALVDLNQINNAHASICYTSNFSCKQDLSFPVCSECALFSCLQQGQQGVTSQHSDILNFYSALWSALLLSLPVHYVHPAPAPLLSDRTFCSGQVGWSVLFWRASCLEADPIHYFLLQKNLFELGRHDRARKNPFNVAVSCTRALPWH